MPHSAETFKYVSLPKYPHMRPADETIWERFLQKYPERFLNVWYDVRVGEPEMPDLDIEDSMKRDWYDLTRWQLDVLAEDAYNFYVIELKPNANAKALGQAIAYTALFTEKRRPKKPVISVVITDKINPITAKAANFMGVELWEA